MRRALGAMAITGGVRVRVPAGEAYAVAQERGRIVRETHDVLAHAVLYLVSLAPLAGCGGARHVVAG
ncbi:hypothetical protein [Kitasatospora sp. NPDC059327]|uniref:hypothetical protein n=1 Tax=Kitasatospora sp. NPDC059327 TaxID=3346803 RepID=UPI0036D1A9A5